MIQKLLGWRWQALPIQRGNEDDIGGVQGFVQQLRHLAFRRWILAIAAMTFVFKNSLKSNDKQHQIKVKSMSALLDENKQLDIFERLQLVEDLWDSVAVRASEFPISDAQRAELDRRLMQHHQEPLRGVTLDQIAQKLGVAL